MLQYREESWTEKRSFKLLCRKLATCVLHSCSLQSAVYLDLGRSCANWRVIIESWNDLCAGSTNIGNNDNIKHNDDKRLEQPFGCFGWISSFALTDPRNRKIHRTESPCYLKGQSRQVKRVTVWLSRGRRLRKRGKSAEKIWKRLWYALMINSEPVRLSLSFSASQGWWYKCMLRNITSMFQVSISKVYRWKLQVFEGARSKSGEKLAKFERMEETSSPFYFSCPILR